MPFGVSLDCSSVSMSVLCWGPSNGHTIVNVPQQSWAQGQDHLPCHDGTAVQEAVGIVFQGGAWLVHGKLKPETQELSDKASSSPVCTQPVLLCLVSQAWESGHEIRHRCAQMSSFDSQYSFYTPIDISWGRNTLWVSELCFILHWTLQTRNVLAWETAGRDTRVIGSASVLCCVTASKKVLQ